MFESASRDGGEDPAPGVCAAPVVSPSWAQRHPTAAALQRAVAGGDLVAMLEALVPADVDAAGLVEAVAAWERVVSFATARQAELIAEMVRRDGAHGTAPEFVADEVAAALAVSRRSGQVLVDRAVGLDGAPLVHDALAAGALDVRKADLLLRETDHLAPGVAATVHTEVLGQAPGLTVPQLRCAVRRAELVLDPTAAAARHGRARAQRCVRMRPAPDAMAWVSAFLPAQDAMVVVTALDAMAAVVTPDDDRPVDARRADALVQSLREVLDRGCTPDGRAIPTPQRRRPHLSITVGAGTLLGLDDAPAYLDGYGLVPADTARQIAQDATWRAVLTDARTGETMARSATTYRPGAVLGRAVTDRDVTCTFPGCRAPAIRCDLDHLRPYDPNRPAAHQTCLENLHALCRHHHRLKTTGRWQPHRDPTTGITTWTAPTGHHYTRNPIPTDPTFNPPSGSGPTGSGPTGGARTGGATQGEAARADGGRTDGGRTAGADVTPERAGPSDGDGPVTPADEDPGAPADDGTASQGRRDDAGAGTEEDRDDGDATAA